MNQTRLRGFSGEVPEKHACSGESAHCSQPYDHQIGELEMRVIQWQIREIAIRIRMLQQQAEAGGDVNQRVP